MSTKKLIIILLLTVMALMPIAFNRFLEGFLKVPVSAWRAVWSLNKSWR